MDTQAEEWAILMPAVCDSYLLWRHSSADAMAVDVEGFEELNVLQVDLNGAPINALIAEEQRPICVSDISSHTVCVPHGVPRAVAIAWDGALPGTTEKPMYTFTFKLLEHYRCLKQCTPANNIEGFTRSLRAMFMASTFTLLMDQRLHNR